MSIQRPPVDVPSPETETPSDKARARSVETIDSARLFAGRREIVILHNRERYVLRITRQGKLILNK